jgi:hypothetical protein
MRLQPFSLVMESWGPYNLLFFPTVLVMASYIDDWSEGSIKRAVRLLSPHRLACFGDNFAKSRPSCPWDPLFLQELNSIRDDTSLGQDIAAKIKRAVERNYWNAKLCAAFFPLVQTAEVLYRNSFDTAIRKLGAKFSTRSFRLALAPSVDVGSFRYRSRGQGRSVA